MTATTRADINTLKTRIKHLNESLADRNEQTLYLAKCFKDLHETTSHYPKTTIHNKHNKNNSPYMIHQRFIRMNHCDMLLNQDYIKEIQRLLDETHRALDETQQQDKLGCGAV